MGADSLSRKLTKSCDKEFPWGRGGITAVLKAEWTIISGCI